jgi:hypothetical protein
MEKSSDLIGNRTRGLLSCSIAPEQTTLPRRKQHKMGITIIIIIIIIIITDDQVWSLNIVTSSCAVG